MNKALEIGLIGAIITVVLGVFITQTITAGGDGENLSGVVKLILGLLPLATAVGTFIGVFRMGK